MSVCILHCVGVQYISLQEKRRDVKWENHSYSKNLSMMMRERGVLMSEILIPWWDWKGNTSRFYLSPRLISATHQNVAPWYKGHLSRGSQKGHKECYPNLLRQILDHSSKNVTLCIDSIKPQHTKYEKTYIKCTKNLNKSKFNKMSCASYPATVSIWISAMICFKVFGNLDKCAFDRGIWALFD